MKINQPYELKPCDVLRLRREELGMTQKDVAKLLGVSAMYISHFEVGIRDIKLVTLEKWATAVKMEMKIDFERKK